MIRWSLVIAFSLVSGSAQISGSSSAPSYSAASIVHAATQSVEALAPNTIGTIYGANLSFTTHNVSTSDIAGSTLPTSLDGVTVVVGNIPANLFFISPTQINFLVPYILTAGTVTIWVGRQGLAGPVVPIQLNSTAPGLFPWNGNLAIAVTPGRQPHLRCCSREIGRDHRSVRRRSGTSQSRHYLRPGHPLRSHHPRPAPDADPAGRSSRSRRKRSLRRPRSGLRRAVSDQSQAAGQYPFESRDQDIDWLADQPCGHSTRRTINICSHVSCWAPPSFPAA